ncbi:hypothetical protein B0H34DRAFT_664336, partial [Crassisporium funariophilum]
AGHGYNFKESAMNKAAAEINLLAHEGLDKTGKKCVDKWGSLRKIYNTVIAIQNVSGWTWSDKFGACITPKNASSWDSYVAKYKDAKNFQNKGWPYCAKMAEVIPASPCHQHLLWLQKYLVRCDSYCGCNCNHSCS